MNAQKKKWARRRRRARHVRRNLFGTPERPRLTVYRSLTHIYGQIIDDLAGRTLVAASTLEPSLRKQLETTGNRDAATRAGQELARQAMEKNIQKVVFDRGPYKYHGRIKAFAEAAREAGLKF
jgi:large subunit ribosomal protein L18